MTNFKFRLIQIGSAVFAMVLVVAVLGGIKYFQISKAIAEHANFAMPPESITSAVAQATVWRTKLETIGSFAAVQGVTLGSEESGKIAKVLVESGSKVEKGQPLLELDTSVEEANLKGAVARADLARQNLNRAMSLKTQSAMSVATVEDSQSKARQAEADVVSIKAVIERKKIVAPFSGRAGIRMVNVGQYVAQGAGLLPLYSVDPIYLNFSVPQNVINTVTIGSKVLVTIDAFAGASFEGKVTAINPNVNEATRNVDIQATVQNADERLKPGMFAKVNLDLGEDKSVVVIPSSGISYAPYGDAVYVIEQMKDPAGKEYKGVRQQIIQVGEQRGDLTAVVAGLKGGEEIATTGAFKLRPQAAVQVHNEQPPGNSEKPNVQDS